MPDMKEPNITDEEIIETALELAKNVPIWLSKLMESKQIKDKARRFAIKALYMDIEQLAKTDVVAAIGVGYLIGYKHAKAETLQKI